MPANRRALPAGSAREVLGGEALLLSGSVVQMMRSPGGELRRPPLALPDRLRLDPVLAERREVDHNVGCVEQPFPDVYELACHERQATGGVGRNYGICRESFTPSSCLRERCLS